MKLFRTQNLFLDSDKVVFGQAKLTDLGKENKKGSPDKKGMELVI